ARSRARLFCEGSPPTHTWSARRRVTWPCDVALVPLVRDGQEGRLIAKRGECVKIRYRGFVGISRQRMKRHDFLPSIVDVTGVVPETENRFGLVVFVPQDAQGGNGEQEVAARRRFEPQPAGGQDAEEMAAGEEQQVSFERA